MSTPYTTRLLSGRAASGFHEVTVPPGFRAVVTHSTLTAWTTTGQTAFVYAAGDVIWYWPAPGANAVQSALLHGVAYAGETVGISTNGQDMGWHITGYLLRDDGQGPRPDAVTREPTLHELAVESGIISLDRALAADRERRRRPNSLGGGAGGRVVPPAARCRANARGPRRTPSARG